MPDSSFYYAQEGGSPDDDFGEIAISDEGECVTVSICSQRSGFWDIDATVSIWDEAVVANLVGWLQLWLSERQR